MPDARKAKVTEYECITCNMVIFGDDLSVSRHMPKNRRFYKGDKVNRLPETVKVFFKSKETIIENATKLLRECEDTLIASNTAVCCKDLQDVLTEQFKNCELCPFGSRISGLGTTVSIRSKETHNINKYFKSTIIFQFNSIYLCSTLALTYQPLGLFRVCLDYIYVYI